MVTSRGPSWDLVGATLVVVVVIVVVVDVFVQVSGTIEVTALTTLDETEIFEFCSSLHANKKLTLSSGIRNFNIAFPIMIYIKTCDATIRRLNQDPWPKRW